MKNNWIRRVIPGLLTQAACSVLFFAIMVIYGQTLSEQMSLSMIGLLILMLVCIPLLMFAAAWLIDVYLRDIIGSLIGMLRGGRLRFNFRAMLRLPRAGLVNAFMIGYAMYICVGIGMMITLISLRA